MKNYEEEMGWVEKTVGKDDFVTQIKEKLLRHRSRQTPKTLVEDHYELESCRTLDYESVSEWIIRNKKEEYDGALLVRLREEQSVQFPIIVGIMFLHNNQVCLGKEHNKKIVHCNYISEELDKLFEGKESLILK